jgi:hypothetical protein
VEVHLVTWNARRRAYETWAWAGAEFAVISPAATVDLWFADRQPGDPFCCPSGYTVEHVGVAGDGLDTLRQSTVPADQLRRVLPPGGLVHREER